jgi:hypothetical protein
MARYVSRDRRAMRILMRTGETAAVRAPTARSPRTTRSGWPSTLADQPSSDDYGMRLLFGIVDNYRRELPTSSLRPLLCKVVIETRGDVGLQHLPMLVGQPSRRERPADLLIGRGTRKWRGSDRILDTRNIPGGKPAITHLAGAFAGASDEWFPRSLLFG